MSSVVETVAHHETFELLGRRRQRREALAEQDDGKTFLLQPHRRASRVEAIDRQATFVSLAIVVTVMR
jgi:hypothetical protein